MLKKTIRLLIALFIVISFASINYKVNISANTTIPYEELESKIDNHGIKQVYNKLFKKSVKHENVKIIDKNKTKNKPVSIVKMDNGKISFYVNGKPFYPLGIETGWWDTRVDDNGKMSSNSADVGEHFKKVSDAEWNNYFKDMHNMGFNTVQLMIHWQDFEPRKGVFDFSFLNHVTDLAYKNGLRTEFVIFFHSQTDNIARDMDKFWGYHFDETTINNKKYALSMQWGNEFTSSDDIRADRDKYGSSHAGIENFLEYWHPEVFKEINISLKKLARNFKNSDKVIGYQIGNEEGFNYYVDSGNDKNPYYLKLKQLYKNDKKNYGKTDNEFRSELINKLWQTFSASIHEGDPYKPTTTNTQGANMERDNLYNDRYSNDGMTIPVYQNVDMIGTMFYGGVASIYPNLDAFYNKNGKGYATKLPMLFPSEISATMCDGNVARQMSAASIARGAQGFGLYCYGELYNNFEQDLTKNPKPVLRDIKSLLKVLNYYKGDIAKSVPTNYGDSKIKMMIKKASSTQGNPTLSLLEVDDHTNLGILYFPQNANLGKYSVTNELRNIEIEINVSELGDYKLEIANTNGSFITKNLSFKNKYSTNIKLDVTGNDVIYLKIAKSK